MQGYDKCHSPALVLNYLDRLIVEIERYNEILMKSVTDMLAGRTSVRRYEREAISPEDMTCIYEAIRNTPTSYNGQQFSVIDVDDQALKEQIYELTGQKQIKTCNRFLLFCIDYHKMTVLARRKGVEMPPFTDTVDGLIVGCVDAALAMMSAVAVAESLGLGACCIGYARTAAPARLAEMLRLPKGVFVVCGLTLGIPREHPDLKPKQPASLLIHHNSYRDDDMLGELMDYDALVHEYNMTRSGSKTDHDWCSHIVDYYREAMGYHLKDVLKERGFDIKD